MQWKERELSAAFRIVKKRENMECCVLWIEGDIHTVLCGVNRRNMNQCPTRWNHREIFR